MTMNDIDRIMEQYRSEREAAAGEREQAEAERRALCDEESRHRAAALAAVSTGDTETYRDETASADLLSIQIEMHDAEHSETDPDKAAYLPIGQAIATCSQDLAEKYGKQIHDLLKRINGIREQQKEDIQKLKRYATELKSDFKLADMEQPTLSEIPPSWFRGIDDACRAFLVYDR